MWIGPADSWLPCFLYLERLDLKFLVLVLYFITAGREFPGLMASDHLRRRGLLLTPADKALEYEMAPWGTIKPSPVSEMTSQNEHNHRPVRYTTCMVLGRQHLKSLAFFRRLIGWRKSRVLPALCEEPARNPISPSSLRTFCCWAISSIERTLTVC